MAAGRGEEQLSQLAGDLLEASAPAGVQGRKGKWLDKEDSCPLVFTGHPPERGEELEEPSLLSAGWMEAGSGWTGLRAHWCSGGGVTLGETGLVHSILRMCCLSFERLLQFLENQFREAQLLLVVVK